MNLIKPKKIKSGDTLCFIAPAGEVSMEKVQIAKEYFENLGYNIVLGKNINKHKFYLSASDAERIEDLHFAFLNSKIDGIVCIRGGYGCLRLIDKIDYELIKSHPKFFCGYSDITVLNALFLKKSNLITFAGPMAQSDFANDIISSYTIENFFKTTQGENLRFSGESLTQENLAKGLLFGGNLSTLVSLAGQDFIPDDKFIFFAEDLNEPAYKLDRYLTQLLNIEKFKKNMVGIILGEFLDLDDRSAFKTIITEIANKYSIPICAGFKITHANDKITIPYGAYAELANGYLTIKNYSI